MDRALVSGTKGPGFDPRVALQRKQKFPHAFQDCSASLILPLSPHLSLKGETHAHGVPRRVPGDAPGRHLHSVCMLAKPRGNFFPHPFLRNLPWAFSGRNPKASWISLSGFPFQTLHPLEQSERPPQDAPMLGTRVGSLYSSWLTLMGKTLHVIPAQAGIQSFRNLLNPRLPRNAGTGPHTP